MLKIKDDVDLKELEKFGFIKTGNETYFKTELNNNWEEYETGIIVNPLNRSCYRELVYYSNSITDGIELDEDSLQLVSTLDTIYVLIQAGLVEKVEDKCLK